MVSYVSETMKRGRYVAVAGIVATMAAVFYVSLRLFSEADVVTTDDGISVSPGALSVRLGTLVTFLVVSIVGLYLSIRLLTRPEPERRDSDSDPHDSWRLYLHRFAASHEDEEGEEDPRADRSE